ncbi:MAG TPA: PEP/pyruvate-binding domain-containing protein [Candidatus Brocadiia bacterium]|nr:PEP/pyruvate-binding domain-containing protein [Candidatus Brocadiia bacterium]
MASRLSTGLPGLDEVFQGLRAGDNIVWQVDAISDYVPFVQPYVQHALASGRDLVYFRYAKHEPLVPEGAGALVCHMRPEEGFEPFITGIHQVIERVGHDAYYVFDALSELSLDLYSDRMLGNFYMLTCPYLYALDTVAYYALLKNYHSYHAASPIAETTQILVDVYRHKGKLYVHPRKVQHRYTPTMHSLHVWEGDRFAPVTESSVIAEVLSSAQWSGLDTAHERPGSWTRTFIQAEETLAAWRKGEAPKRKLDEAFHLGLRMAITHDERALALAEKYFTLQDVLDVKKRMLSSGLIGGKAVGMLLARAILLKADPKWQDILEPHDSFFIGSEVFYSFIVRNHCWRLRQKQKNPKTFLDGADEARQRMLMGAFPDVMIDRFQNLLDYFGQAPIIVRSSSLLEDNFGNAFAGKYESVFCPNQGPRHVRLDDFLTAVRTIYASSMSEEALTYRAERGVLDKDEQMALLVQRVSGVQHGSLYFPHCAGVGFSFNPYVWDRSIDPKAGMIRLVCGLGTRAVDRADDDYTRVVALNAPQRRPEASFAAVRNYAQRRMDVLDLQANQLMSYDFVDVARRCPDLPLRLIATQDPDLLRMAEERQTPGAFPWVLTFDGLLSETSFADDMREMLSILQDAYGCPVDVEFTLNFRRDGGRRINLLQCRPLQVKGRAALALPAANGHSAEDALVQATGAVIGQSRLGEVGRFIYVVPAEYAKLNAHDRYEVAKVVGQLMSQEREREPGAVVLMGPGRWGTSTPALGVPVSFRDIRGASVLCEIVAMSDDLVPDVSLGTHFFSDLIEHDILYVALFPNRQGNHINSDYFLQSPNRLPTLLPSAAKWQNVIRVVDPGAGRVCLSADTFQQRFLCRPLPPGAA